MSQGNVDLDEIEKFETIASRWWDREGEFRPLHEINPLRVDYIEREAGGLEGKRVLDVGCGGGILSEALAARGARVTGIDAAELSIEVARMHLHESGLEVDYRVTTVERFAAENDIRFDLVCCLELLEHVPDPASVIRTAATLTRTEGSLILSTINRNPKAFALAIVGAEYLLGLLPRGTHEYRRFIRPSELAAELRAAGMRVHDITGMTYNPITRAYRLGPDIDVNYLLSAGFDG